MNTNMENLVPTESVPARPRDWKKLHALGLPEGSVRALLAVAIFATIWVRLARQPEREVPDYLRDLLFIIMGHYFASRKRASSVASVGPGSLFLPRGTIRLILFGGFVVVAVVLVRQGKLSEPLKNPGVVTLMLVGGFLLGVAGAKVGDWWAERGHHVPRWIEDFKAVVAILAAVALILMVWNPLLMQWSPEVFDKLQIRLGNYGPQHILGAVVGFYFGSRS